MKMNLCGHVVVYDIGEQKGFGKVPSFQMGQCLVCKTSIKMPDGLYEKVETMYLTLVQKREKKEGVDAVRAVTDVFRRCDVYRRKDDMLWDYKRKEGSQEEIDWAFGGDGSEKPDHDGMRGEVI